MPKPPTLIMANEHDLQPLPDVQVNGLPLSALVTVTSPFVASARGVVAPQAKQSHDDHKPDRTDIEMT